MTCLPAPFPGKGATVVRFTLDLLAAPPWGGPTEVL